MKHGLPFVMLLALHAVTASAHAGDAKDGAGVLATQDPAPSRWRFGASYAPFLGLKTNFTGLGNFRSPFTPQPLGGGVDYDYDDGFVHVDSSGNFGGETWNWGYQNSSQHDPSGQGSVSFSQTNSLANASAKEEGGGEAGFEAFAYFDMGKVDFLQLNQDKASWGFRGGLQYARVNVDNSNLLASGIIRTIDTFGLNGNILPQAPYSGSYGGPGPLLGDSPSRETVIGGGQALVAGSRELDVHLTVLNFGPYLEIPVTERFDLFAEAGISLGIASGDYDFMSSTSIAGLGTQVSSGSDSATRFLPGAYAGLTGAFRINDQWSLLASGRYQYMKPFELGANGSSADLSFDSAFVVSLGVLVSF